MRAAYLPLCILFSAMLASGPAFADMYKCIENNQATYSSTPCGQHAQEVQNKVSVVAAPVPAAQPAGGANSGGAVGATGITSSDVVIALLALIPLSIIVMVAFSRNSK